MTANRESPTVVKELVTRILPSPSGDRIALTVASAGPSRGYQVLTVPASDQQLREPICSFDTLLPVVVSWASDGQSLASAQGGLLQVSRGDKLFVRDVPFAVRYMHWHGSAVLWGVSDHSVWRAIFEDGFWPHVISDCVECACLFPPIAVLEHGSDVIKLISQKSGNDAPLKWPLSLRGNPAILPSVDGRGMFVYAEEPSGPSRMCSEFAYLGLSSRESTLLFRHEIATGLGWKRTAWFPWVNRQVLLLCEIDKYPRLFLVSGATDQPVPLSPTGFEVSGFAASPASGRIALTGTYIGRDSCASQNWLLACDRNLRDGTSCMVLRTGVNSHLVWTLSGRRLYYMHAVTSLSSSLESYNGSSIEPRADPQPSALCLCRCRTPGVPAFELEGPVGRPVAILHVQSPHRRFLEGPQSTFLHHAISSLLHEFASFGYLINCLNGPGSSGKGRSHRECEPSWLVALSAALKAQVGALRRDGFTRIGLVTGSLGALVCLNFLMKEPLDAAVLFSPVYSPQIPSLAGWSHLFEPVDELPDPQTLAGGIRTPLLIFHGLGDEVSPLVHSSKFVTHLRSDVECEYVTFAEEGHIFRNPATWEKGLGETARFLRKQLEAYVSGFPA
jgi:hypothetical protein